jgi:hypothetical protein
VRLLLLIVVAWAVSGCSSGTSCTELGAPSGLATHAAILRLEIYPDTARCSGDQIAPGSAPLRSLELSPTAPARVDLASGTYVVHVAAYGDSAATQLLGEGCSAVTIRAGDASCLALPLRSSMPDGCAPAQHSNGVGQSYADCAPIGTVDARLGAEACDAFSHDAANCRDQGCSGSGTARAICYKGATDCTCWTYTGPNVGHVRQAAGGSCTCGDATDPTWN